MTSPHSAMLTPAPLRAAIATESGLRNRHVSAHVLSGRLAIPAPSAHLTADWSRDVSTLLDLEAGDVGELSLPRARSRWPDYANCLQKASQWLQAYGLQSVPHTCEVALMACRGARFHHDTTLYGGMAFCNLFVSEDKGLDLFFPVPDIRIPLCRGSIVVFDTAQVHGVVPRQRRDFLATDFPASRDCTQVFLTWELPMDNRQVAAALQIQWDPPHPPNQDAAAGPADGTSRLERGGLPVGVCPRTGQWQAPAVTPIEEE